MTHGAPPDKASVPGMQTSTVEDMHPSAAPASRTEPWVVFDGDCGFCTSSARWLARRLAGSGPVDVRLTPWQDTDLEALGIDPARAWHEVLWVPPEGPVSGGAPAVAAWLRHAGSPWAVPGRMMDWPGARYVAARAYRLVADHRDRLPGGTPACSTTRP